MLTLTASHSNSLRERFMVMAKRVKSAPLAVPGVGVEVVKATFLQGCAKALRVPLRAHNVYPMQRSCKMGELYYFSTGSTEFAAPGKRDMDEIPVTVVPGTKNRFWIAANVRLQVPGRSCFVEHLGVKVYAANQAQGGKVLRIRGEWDLRSDVGIAHAQPHWHVHPVDDIAIPKADVPPVADTSEEFAVPPGKDWSDDELVFWRGLLQEQAAERASLSMETRLSGGDLPLPNPTVGASHKPHKIHLAMVAGWHMDPDPGHVVGAISEPGIYRWIAGVTSYVIGQLQYISDVTDDED